MTAGVQVRRIGVVGAGTMGAGIAQVAAQAGIETVLHDPFDGALAAGGERIAGALERGAQRGRWSSADAAAARARLTLATAVEDLGSCDLVVEAAPESLEIKGRIFGQLAEACGPDTVLATNTSSIPVTAIAATTPGPARVVGMHFFNPVPAMKLVEVIAAEQTAPGIVERTARIVGALGKSPVLAADGPGFLVNRCGRPFYNEALRLVQERRATPEQVDRICRMGAGFRMGPFELMDLVGIDVGYAVAQSFTELSFGEPRWKPNVLQSRLVAAGTLGRKTGSGWYRYDDGPHRPEDPEPPAPGGAIVRLAIDGDGVVADRLRSLATAAGHALDAADPEVVVHTGDVPRLVLDAGPVHVVSCARSSLVGQGAPDAVGFALAPGEGPLVELTRSRRTTDEAARAAETLFTSLGLAVEWVGDAPGLVLHRIVAQLVNEACFVVGEGVAVPDDVNVGARLGLNHPRGPLEWGDLLGWDEIARTLDGIWDERREERYRTAPLLREAALLGGLEDA